MLTKTQKKILASLLNNYTDEHFSIRGIAKKLGLSYTLAYNNISALENLKIIRKADVPPAQIISIHDLTPQEVLVDIELETRNNFFQKHPWAKVMHEDILLNIRTPFFILLIFGSYAKAAQTPKSDLDLLVIVQNDEFVKEIENAVNKAYTKIKKSLIIVKADEFKEMIKDPNLLNVGNEARKSHILLHGAENYHQMLMQAYKR